MPLQVLITIASQSHFLPKDPWQALTSHFFWKVTVSHVNAPLVAALRAQNHPVGFGPVKFDRKAHFNKR